MKAFSYMKCIGKNDFRFDTRIYLSDSAEPSNRDTMIAAIVGKNPGSARPKRRNELSLLDLNGGKLPPIVRNCFLEAYSEARIDPLENGYIQVWNLFYLTDPYLKNAIRKVSEIETPEECRTETSIPPIVWFAWGRPKKAGLEHFAKRFLAMPIQHPLYVCMDKKKIVSKIPLSDTGAKHPQGLSTKPVVKHLASILRSIDA